MSWARTSFILPIFTTESLRAASSDCSLLSCRDSSVMLLLAYGVREGFNGKHRTKKGKNRKHKNIQKSSKTSLSPSSPEPVLQTAAPSLAPEAASQPPPAGGSPSPQITLHAELKLDSHSDPTASVCSEVIECRNWRSFSVTNF